MRELRHKVTYFAPFVPFRSIPHAGGQFLFHYLCRLSQSVDVTLIAPGSAVNQAALGEEVPAVEIHLVIVRPKPRTRIGHLPRLLANTVAGVTPGWQVLRGFRRDPWVWERVRTSDLVELQWAWYLPFVDDIRSVSGDTPVTAFEHDVLTESLARRARRGAFRERTVGRFAAARARRLEPRLLNRCDTVFTFSRRERALLVDLGVQRPVEVVDPLVLPSPPRESEARSPTVLFVGDMSRPENHQGAGWLALEVWPLVASACPEARLILAGSKPPPSLQLLDGAAITVTGYVEDLDALYRRASVFAAANLTGAGVKFKVLDALRHGLPVVATPIAAEGIADGPGSPGFGAITESPADMASALVTLLSNVDESRAIGAAGQAWVGSNYDFAASVDRVLATYTRLIAAANDRRSAAAAAHDAAKGTPGNAQIE